MSKVDKYLLSGSLADVGRSVPVAELRQNPAPALQAVAAGETLMVTSHNRPIADLVPHRERRGVTPQALVAALLRTPVDADWSKELEEARAADTDDPWSD